MLVNFSFYVQKFHDLDAEYRITLTTFDEINYNRSILKEGFLYSNGKVINKDQVVLDLPVNESELIKNHFEIQLSAIQTARTKLNKPIKINLLQLEVNNIPVKRYLRKHIIHNTMLAQSQTEIVIPENATVSLLIPGALIYKDDNFYIQNYDYQFNNKQLWSDLSKPITLNNISD